jgi:hypothetical protein
VTLQAKNANNTTQSFVGCYRLHLARPDFQIIPPFHPMGIINATVSPVPNNANFASLMSGACR